MSDDRLPPAILLKFPEYAKLIAEVIGTWNTLEDQSRLLFVAFTYIHPTQSALVMSAMASSQARLDVIRAAGRFALKNDPSRLKELEDLFDFLEKRLRVRNQYAHAVYVTNDQDQLCILRRRYEFSDDPKSIRIVDFEALKSEILLSLDAGRRLSKFHDLLLDEMDQKLWQALQETWTSLPFPRPTNQQ